ncbi:MAG TPA: hypothetical protein O0X25_04230 [Methanocorpusculum sp.]|nr:hypothetical protein [Methanocorpusculum sp.]HJJ40478.1 hypothetical protein [Methanocorpusculum sp.]HJJ49807.1 hypothetical protein [Methanocorpusculum sp.]HJJ57356.1 hypothetical protein [Methanocorpusculum sp.]
MIRFRSAAAIMAEQEELRKEIERMLPPKRRIPRYRAMRGIRAEGIRRRKFRRFLDANWLREAYLYD